MLKILKYSFYDLSRSRWTYIYCGFYLIFTFSLLALSNDLSKVVISLMNVVLLLCPLIATMFGVMYYYNSREFTELLLAQPLRRRSIFIGQYLGVAGSLSASWLVGTLVPFAMYGVFGSEQASNFFTLAFVGVALSFIFSALAFLIALKNENRIKGFGLAILTWLLFAVIYDGALLLSLSIFHEYPLERFSLIASMLNPIDLSRILILLKLDVSALMGYTGAVFRKFLGTGFGIAMSLAVLGLWAFLPVGGISWVAKRKDF
jgi:Cu-processing system permease protein